MELKGHDLFVTALSSFITRVLCVTVVFCFGTTCILWELEFLVEVLESYASSILLASFDILSVDVFTAYKEIRAFKKEDRAN